MFMGTLCTLLQQAMVYLNITDWEQRLDKLIKKHVATIESIMRHDLHEKHKELFAYVVDKAKECGSFYKAEYDKYYPEVSSV
jgi:hypothetical protein